MTVQPLESTKSPDVVFGHSSALFPMPSLSSSYCSEGLLGNASSLSLIPSPSESKNNGQPLNISTSVPFGVSEH